MRQKKKYVVMDAQQFYLSPDIRVVCIACEYGFGISNIEIIEGENPEQDW